jgi:SAM-dependent methyltransferase
MSIERLEPGTKEWDAFYSNHIQRYQFALDQINRSDTGKILDAACGAGFGSHFLAENTKHKVVGIDNDSAALNIANRQFKSETVEFIKDDCNTMECVRKFAPFEYVVSFETLEHLPEPDCFLKNVFNLLKPGGTLVLSTPNKSVTSPGGKINWAFHEKEYTAAELTEALVTAGFTDIQFYGQRFNQRGKLKNEIRAELNILYSNPFQRIGRFFQTALKRRKFGPILKETTEDLEIVPFKDPYSCDSLKADGPFVLIVVTTK